MLSFVRFVILLNETIIKEFFMPAVIEKPEASADQATQKHFFRIFLEFRKPDGSASLFYGDGTSGCGVYAALAKIFDRSPKEIYDTLCDLAYEKGNGFMQEYLSLEDASAALTKAILFSDTVDCVCFLKQEARFYID
jgi:hypothetical protein